MVCWFLHIMNKLHGLLVNVWQWAVIPFLLDVIMDICACGTTLSQAADYACLFFKWHVALQMTCATPAKCQRRIHNMHIIKIKSKVSTFPICVIFHSVVAFLKWLYNHMCHIHPGKSGEICFCFHYYCAIYDMCKQSGTLWPEGSIRLFEMKWNACQVYSAECVSQIKSMHSIIYYELCGFCVFSLPIYLCMTVIIFALHFIITKYEIMVYDACLTMFLLPQYQQMFLMASHAFDMSGNVIKTLLITTQYWHRQ